MADRRENILISSYEQVNQLLEGIINSEAILKDKNISISEKLGGIKIHLTGSKHNSTISAGIMRGIIDLQRSIYEAYSLSKYGKLQKLSKLEKRILELQVKIDKGSSVIEIFINRIAETIGGRIQKMSTKEIASILVLLILSSGVYVTLNRYFDAKKEIALKESQNKLVSDIQKNTIYAIESVQRGVRGLNRALDNEQFETLEINGVEISHEELHEKVKTTREKRQIENKVYVGKFIITDIHLDTGAVYINVIDTNTQKTINYINILSELINEEDYQWVKDAINRQTIDMTIVTTEKQGNIISAVLQSFKK